MRKILFALALSLVFACAALADIRPLETPTPKREETTGSRTKCAQAMIGGLFLSLAIIFVGLRLARARKAAPKTAAAGEA